MMDYLKVIGADLLNFAKVAGGILLTVMVLCIPYPIIQYLFSDYNKADQAFFTILFWVALVVLVFWFMHVHDEVQWARYHRRRKERENQ